MSQVDEQVLNMTELSFWLSVILYASLVQFQVRAELTCSPTNTSAIGVSFDSSQNQTGGWQHSFVLSKKGLQTKEPSGTLWNVEVGYQPVHCSADEKDSLNIKISLSSRQNLNPEYKFYPGLGYYKYQPTLDTWLVAKATCEREGAHLANINSQQEADALKQLIVSDPYAHLGLIKHEAKGEFITLFGDPISKTGYSVWAPGVNPANAAATQNAVLYKVDGKLTYGDQGAKRSSICEVAL